MPPFPVTTPVSTSTARRHTLPEGAVRLAGTSATVSDTLQRTERSGSTCGEAYSLRHGLADFLLYVETQ